MGRRGGEAGGGAGRRGEARTSSGLLPAAATTSSAEGEAPGVMYCARSWPSRPSAATIAWKSAASKRCAHLKTSSRSVRSSAEPAASPVFCFLRTLPVIWYMKR